MSHALAAASEIASDFDHNPAKIRLGSDGTLSPTGSRSNSNRIAAGIQCDFDRNHGQRWQSEFGRNLIAILPEDRRR